jgi:hypothetical protein
MYTLALFSLIPAGLVLYRLVVWGLREGYAIPLLRAGLVVLVGLAASQSWAGALWRGYCYASTADAVSAWCNEARIPFPVAAGGGARVQPSTTVGINNIYFAGGAGHTICTANTVTGNAASVTVDRKSTRLNSSHRLTSRMPSSA